MRPYIISLALAVLLMTPTTPAQCETEQLFAPLASAGDSFGQSLDFNGDELVVGSRYSATIFIRQDPGTPLDDTDDVWVVHTNLLGESISDGFGSEVALDGEHLLVGAPFVGGFISAGAAYLFVRYNGGTPGDLTDDTWAEQAKFVPPVTDAVPQFGSAVALDGDRLAVGAPFGNLTSGAPKSGFVQVARRDDDGGTPDDPTADKWSTEALLLPPDGGIFFGAGVHLFGSELLVVGRTAEFVNQVYRFRLDDADTLDDPSDDFWVENGLILAPPGGEPAFGQDIDRDGDRMLIGGNEIVFAYRLDDAGTPTDPLDDQWLSDGFLIPSDGGPTDSFGAAVSLHGGRALVGAWKHVVEVSPTGAAYLFQRDETAADPDSRWKQVLKLISPFGGNAKKFGVAVLLAGDVAFVGESGFFQFLAPQDTSTLGSTWIYAMAEPPWSFIDSALPGVGGMSPCLIGAGSLAPNSDVALVLEDASASSLAAIVLGSDIGNVPFKGGVLVPAPQYIAWVATSRTGDAFVSGRWPSNFPTGFLLCVQAWMLHESGPAGFVASNAVRGDAP